MLKRPTNWQACERGNTWLVNGDNHLAFFQIDEDLFLRVSLCPETYPGFQVNLVQSNESDLAEDIQRQCVGWLVRKCNVKGVKVDAEGYVHA